MTIKIPLGLLTLVFVTLKLAGVIAWSWWWVLSPLLAGITLVGLGWFLFPFLLMWIGSAILLPYIEVDD